MSMRSLLRPLAAFISAALLPLSPILAQNEDPPVLEDPPAAPAEEAPAESVEAPPAQPPAPAPDGKAAPSEAPPAAEADVPAPVRRAANVETSNRTAARRTAPVAALPPGEGPVTVIPTASGDLVVRPPVITPPEVIDEPWTVRSAIPWLVAGLLVGGGLVALTREHRRRRRLLYVEGETAQVAPTIPAVPDTPVSPPQPTASRLRPTTGTPSVLVRWVKGAPQPSSRMSQDRAAPPVG